MPLIAGESHILQLQKSKARTDGLLQKYRYKRVIAVLGTNNAKLYEIEQGMVSEGLLEPLDMKLTPKTTPLAITDKEMESARAPTEDDPYAEADDVKPFNRNQTTFGMCSFQVVFRGLLRAEPTIFTAAHLKALQVRGQRSDSLKTIQNLLEAVTDIAPDDIIDISMRNKAAVIQHIVKQYVKKVTEGNS